jgi:hypothetical protein
VSRRWLLLRTRIPAGFGLLAMVASCLPQAGVPLQSTQRPIATVTMINRLALDLPADIAAKLPALVDATVSNAAISDA